MKQPIARLLTGFAIVAVLLVVASVIFTFSQSPPVLAPLPKPNGYDDFLKAAGMITGDFAGYRTMSEEALQAFVKQHAEALKLARTGLGRECRVPLDYSAAGATNLSNLALLKRLGLTLAAEGRLAELESRPADAAEANLAVIRLSYAMSQGGLIIDSLVGIALDNIGTAAMENLAPTLDAQQCRAAAAAIESCEARREPTHVFRTRERIWARRIWGFRGQLARLMTFKQLKQSEQRWEAKVTAQQIRTRRLLMQLATRAYELEKGERPKRLADLVPAYLKAIPQDPLTGTNLTYP